jgi:hypothetical protein
MVEQNEFFAWLDGELSPDDAARVEAEVAADGELARRAQEHGAMTSQLRGAFGTVEAQPVPERLQRAIQTGSDSMIVDIGEARSARERRAQPLWVQAAALAATLVVRLFTGNLLSGGMAGDGSPRPIEARGGLLVASADLGNALSARLASAPADDGPRIGLTFREKNGAICRTFEDQSASGFACRDSGGWRIRSLFQGAESQATDYRMASGPEPQLMEAVEAVIDGEPLDAAQEKAALENGWK